MERRVFVYVSVSMCAPVGKRTDGRMPTICREGESISAERITHGRRTPTHLAHKTCVAQLARREPRKTEARACHQLQWEWAPSMHAPTHAQIDRRRKKLVYIRRQKISPDRRRETRTSRTRPAWPSLSAESSEKRGTILPPVAMAMSSISGPPTHRTAGRPFWSSRWLASSSNPHWQITRFAPVALTCKYGEQFFFFLGGGGLV